MGDDLMEMETLKHKPDEFGGFQTNILTQSAIEQRMCCAQNCGNSGFAQVEIPLETPTLYRIACKRHYVLIQLMVAAALGDPSPAGEARRVAEAILLDWRAFLESVEPKHAVQPGNFICLVCGGVMMPETAGMFAGKRWVHTCGE